MMNPLQRLQSIFRNVDVLLITCLIQFGAGRFPAAALEIEGYQNLDKSAVISTVASTEIECSGRLAPRKSFTLVLGAEESVEYIAVKAGDHVQKGDLLARLVNYALLDHLISLQAKRLSLMEAGDQIRLLDKRIESMEKAVHRLENRIAKERSILIQVGEKTIDSYLIEWTEELREKQDALSILKTERNFTQNRLAQETVLENALNEKAKKLSDRIDDLAVCAPFAGHIDRVSENYGRALPGDRIIELRDDNVLIVNATVWQHQLPYIHIGSRAKIYPNFFQNEAIQGTVVAIGPSSSTETNGGFPVFPVTIELTKTPAGLISGMGVSVLIVVDGKKHE